MNPSNIENDLSLLSDFNGGKEQAFDQIFMHFHPLLCVFAARILQDELAVEDIVQEALIKAWTRRTDFSGFSPLKSFLFICVRNACFNELEKVKVRNKFDDVAKSEKAADEQDALKDIIYAEVVNRVFLQVDTLPEQCRRVIRMTFQEEMTPKEIAKTLGISISTVNSQKMRGLQLLRTKLSKTDFYLVLSILFPHLWK